MSSADEVMSLKVSELKAQLTTRGLATTGIKSVLQKRLLQAVNADAAAPAASAGMDVDDADKTGGEADETIDESVRYKGTVNKFFKRRGFGTITPEGQKADDKDAQIFVHWKQIQSSDPWPALEDGQVVEYYLGEKKNPRKKNQKTFAAQVTLEGGNPVTTNADANRNFPDRGQRFAGIVKWFDPRKGFGFVKPKEDFCFEEVDFTSDKANIYVCREDIKTAAGVDSAPSLKDKAEIEFTLYKKDDKDNWGAGDVTKAGGEALGADDFKQRRTGPRTGPRKGKKGKKRKGQFGNMQFGNFGNFNFQQMFGGGGKKKKGKKGKKKGGRVQGFQMMPMGGMGMGGFGGQPQLVQMNGQTYMMMPQANNFGFANFAQGGGQKKKRRRNKKKNN